MIAHLRGKLLSKWPNRVIIEAAGVGYEVFIPVSTFYEMGDVATEVSLQVYSYVRQESFSLYGFRTEQEKSLFEKLLSVSGVGPKLAITILSGLEIEELIPALRKRRSRQTGPCSRRGTQDCRAAGSGTEGQTSGCGSGTGWQAEGSGGEAGNR